MNTNQVYALVWASTNPEKYGNIIFKDLTKKWYHIIPINPKESSIEGIICYPNISTIPTRPDMVIFVTPPTITLSILQECKQIGIDTVRFQPGASDQSCIQFCQDHAIHCTADACMMKQWLPKK